MRILHHFLLLVVIVVPSLTWAGTTIEVMTTLDDVFRIAETDEWSVKLERQLQLRFADVRLNEKRGYPFSLMLYFKSDTPDLAQFDSPEKMERAVRLSSEKYLPGIVEKEITLRKVPVLFTYGFFAVFTDAKIAEKTVQAPGEYKHLTRGMVRLSKNSALGFSLMTNDTDSPDYQRLLEYVYSFVKPGSKD